MLTIDIPDHIQNIESIDNGITIIHHGVVSNIHKVMMAIYSVMDCVLFDDVPTFVFEMSQDGQSYKYSYDATTKEEVMYKYDNCLTEKQYTINGKLYSDTANDIEVLELEKLIRDMPQGEELINSMPQINNFTRLGCGWAENMTFDIVDKKSFSHFLSLIDVANIKFGYGRCNIKQIKKKDGTIMDDPQYLTQEIQGIYAINAYNAIQSNNVTFFYDFGNELTPEVQEYLIKFMNEQRMERDCQFIISTIHQHVIEMFKRFSISHKVIRCK